MEVLNFIVQNWVVLLICAILAIFIGICIYNFMQLPIEEKYKTIRAYLLYAVTIAEENWGNGTGPIKLGEVYDAFTDKYPILKLFISWETFNILVDSALHEMRRILEEKQKQEQEVIDNETNATAI